MLKQNKPLLSIQNSMGTLFSKLPLSPNAWTILSLLVALVAGLVIAFQNNLVAGLALFALAGALDMVDGAVARASGQVSNFGGFIDGITDRFVEAIFLFSFMFYQLPTIFIDSKIWLALVIFLGTSMPSFIRAYADHKGVLKREKALALGGICERSERIVLLVIGLLAGIFYSMDIFIYTLILIIFLSLLTIVQRMIQIKNNMQFEK